MRKGSWGGFVCRRASQGESNYLPVPEEELERRGTKPFAEAQSEIQ